MLTEVFNSPEPEVTESTLPNQAGLALNDQSLGFGWMRMGTGRAFLLGQSAADPGVFVAKSWVKLDGRQFLVEEVPVNAITEGLATLPLTALNGNLNKVKYLASKHLTIPKHTAGRKSASVKMIANGHLPEKGFVLDYLAVNSSMTNYTFQCDSTYYLSGATYLYGTNTFEGGAILKYTNNASLNLEQNAQWLGGQYRPVIFTSKDDNSIGDTIGGSTGNPTNYYANPALNYLSGSSANASLSNIRVSYAQLGLEFQNAGAATVEGAQVVSCASGIQGNGGSIYLYNSLFSGVQTNVVINGTPMDGENITFANSKYLISSLSSNTWVHNFTNCIFANITNLSAGFSYSLGGDNNGFYNTPVFGTSQFTNSSPFQTVGDSHYYLSNICNFHNAGTTNINPALLDELPNTTTYPPFVHPTGTLSVPTNLSIYAQRDNIGNPDLGYHYDPLDYVFGGSDLHSNLTFSAGTAVGYYAASGSVGSSGQPYGLSLNSGASFNTIGTATSPCWVVDYKNVQEGSGSWSDSGWMGALMLNGGGSGATPQINSTFTKWGRPWALFFRDNSDHGGASFVNCEFYGGSCATYDSSYLYFTNCLLYREAIYCFDQEIAPSFTMQNCTFYNGLLAAYRLISQPLVFWKVENTSFDGTGFYIVDQLNGTNSETLINYNAYNTNNLSGLSYSYPYGATTNIFEVVGPNDKMISTYNWQSNWFGNFYLPTNSPVIKASSTNANLLGLYHFTTQTNQVVDGTNIVTIGYHYVATDGSGNPLDSNGDGIPDYLEDANGDGLVDNGETNWALAILVQPMRQTNLEGGSVTFAVTADGIAPLQYQWYFDSSNVVVGATNAFLMLSNIQPAQAGSYSVVVTNSFGSLSSSNAILVVNPTSFNFSKFCDVTNLQINGNADLTTTADGCVLELTPSAGDMAGSAFLKVPVALSGNASFSTFFSFRLSKDGGPPNSGSDGQAMGPTALSLYCRR